MNKVFIALIHNRNTERNAKIIPALTELQSWLVGLQFDVNLIDVAYQPEIRPHSRSIAFLRDVIYQVTALNWQRYCGVRPLLLRHIVALLRKIFKIGRYATAGGWRRSSAIEMTVTDKHIRAWSDFLEKDHDFLICFEDDAVFTDDSKCRLANLLEKLVKDKSDRMVYVDLAGGCSVDALRIDKLQASQDELYRYYRKPVTNTACVYLMSSSLVAHFHGTLVRRPWLRMIGVDWMMNALLMRLEKDGQSCFCIHTEPTFFKHGSFTGEYMPWSR
jgi:hypothetical protein